ncbi:MAG TPA: histidine-type phosphatase, partial [Selenomonas sp.]|nr:histidine-type phosphatase [Selenomonas sp.]
MRNSILALLLCTLLATCAAAQPSRHDLQRNPLLCAANHVAYPWNDANLPRLTPPPAGYEPFYIDHY